MTSAIALLALSSAAVSQNLAQYRLDREGAIRASTVRTFTLALGTPVEKHRWVSLAGVKASGEQFQVWLLSAGYPPPTLPAARSATARYLVREGTARPREYRHQVTKEAVLPAMGGWEHLMPRPSAGTSGEFPERVRYLGQGYVREKLETVSPVQPPPDPVIVELRPDLLIGPASNRRQKDETRRYDQSDYEYVRLTLADYREMAAAGITCVAVDQEQARWAEDLGLYYWGAIPLPFPELLYRSQYLGPALYLDEPAVGTRDHVLRPRLEKDPAFRKTITPQVAFEEFAKYFDHARLEGAPRAMMRGLAARADVDLGDLNFPQQNLYSWETMVSTAAYQLSRGWQAPDAMVFEPPGRLGTRRTVPEMNMTYGTQLPAGDSRSLIDIVIGFLRGATRMTEKSWGISIYGAVDRADTFGWLTRAYDLGATRFFFWDNYQLACVPYGEYLVMARHLTAHARSRPPRDLERLRRAGEVAILLPPGYDLGHVHMGKGNLWGIGELNLERQNRHGVTYRAVMSNFFAEIERCLRLGIAFDLLWDLPDAAPKGYRELVRIREDGKVEVRTGDAQMVLDRARTPERAPGPPPGLDVTLLSDRNTEGVQVTARARVVETSAPVYYTLGADASGTYHNAMVAWELYGPGEEDYRFLAPEGLKPLVRGNEVEIRFRLDRPGAYRLRAATVDWVGRSTVVWKRLTVATSADGRLALR
jgi:hypothetical protein